ncbi:MAG: 30S ribosomal subunit protein S16 [Candidatus Westeberhardia cardiocondylae]|nr:30S ribosomal subunit protein S16 [Candidatus Westeberhardia cardiocondylae]
MIKIRLSRRGHKNHPFYLVVVADKRNPRDGRFIERVGFFDPFSQNVSKGMYLYIDRLQYWINQGAKISKRVSFLIKKFRKND